MGIALAVRPAGVKRVSTATISILTPLSQAKLNEYNDETSSMSGAAPPHPLDFTWILPNLAMGGARTIGYAEHLARAHGIRHIVDVRLEDKDDEEVLRHHGMTLLHLPTEDLCAIALEMIDHGVAWVRRHLDAGDRVFIHCQWGIGRSALLTCCVLVSLGHSPGEALAIAKKNRPIVSPSPEQLEALLAWSRHHRAQQGEPPPMETWVDLADVAYGHRKDT